MRQISIFLSRHEQGQSAIVIAGALVALVAVIALVVDGGNAYAQRRQLQNALDAGAQAGAIQMTLVRTNGQIDAAIQDYVQRNGVDPSLVNAYFVTQDANGVKYVERATTIHNYSSTSYPPQSINGRDVYGLTVEGVKQFPTYFAGVVGWRQMQVGTDSMRPAASVPNPPTGTCQAEDIFPITISANTFSDDNRDGIVEIHFMDTEPTYAYRIWEKKPTELSNFGYVTWNGTNNTSTLNNYMTTVTTSGRWSKGDNMPYASGDMGSGTIYNTLRGYWTSQTPITVPVYDFANGNISSYRIIGFTRMVIVGGSSSGAAAGSRYLDVKFQRFVEPTGGGQCPYYGDGTIVPPVTNITRRLVGTVKLSKITPVGQTTQEDVHIPVEVTNVLDISGSMSANFGAMTKLNAAKTALRNFNSNMLPAMGDKVALVTYPLITSGTRYNFSCQQSGSTTSYYTSEQRSALTSNISAVNTIINGLTANGGTPIAAGMQQGRLTALGAGHDPAKASIIILASDGLANIRVNGRWTGFDGNAYNSLACNVGAVQDALDQANLAKGDSNNDGSPDTIIFTIAVGDDFNPDLMQAIASVDTDPSKPHYFRVTDAASMNNIYNQIANRVQHIQNESCEVIQTEAFAGGATLNIRNRDTGQTYVVTTTSTGEFVLNNVSPGTFEFTSASVTINGFTYNVFTNGVGGPALGANPTVAVGDGAGTYKTDLFLKTTDSVSCTGG